MDDISVKYRLLNKKSRRELDNFIDFLLTRQKSRKKPSNIAYKKRLLTVSTWSDRDIAELNRSRKLLNDWKIEEW